MLLVLLGGAAVLLALALLDWYDLPGGRDAVDAVAFGDLRAGVDGLDLPGVVSAYFHWLAWVLLLAVILAGVLVHAFGVAGLRYPGLALGLLGAAATYYALQQVKSYGDEGTYALREADAGVWCALAGFVLAGVGAALGPRRSL